MSEYIHKARLAVCHYADDAEEARLFMRMLGIHPGDELTDRAIYVASLNSFGGTTTA